MNATQRRGWLALVGITVLAAAVVAADITLRNGARLIIDSSARIVDEEGDWTLSAEQLRSAVLDPITTNDLSGVAGATGLQLLAATNQAAAQTIIGASGSAQMLFETADPPASPPSATNSGAIAFSTTGKQYLWSTNSQAWGFFAGRGAQADLGYPVSFLGRTPGANAGNDWWAPYGRVDQGGLYNDSVPSTDVLAADGTYTSSIETWVAQGSNTVVTNAGRLEVTYVDSPYGAKATFNTGSGTLTELQSLSAFYRISFEAYAVSGTCDVVAWHDGSVQVGSSGLGQTGALPATNTAVALYLKTISSDNNDLRMGGMSAGDVISLDNLRVDKIAPSNCVAINTNLLSGDVVVRGGVQRGTGYAGIVARANNPVWPTTYLALVANQRYETYPCTLYKVIAGTWTSVTNLNLPWSTPGGELGLEIECEGTNTTVRLNGHPAVVVTTPTDVPSTNIYHGVIHTGGTARIGSWCVQTPTQARQQASSVWVNGGSLGANSASYGHYAIGNSIYRGAARRLVYQYQSQNGYTAAQHFYAWDAWERNTNYPTPSAIVLDLWANHAYDAGAESKMAEGAVRRARTRFPNAALLSFAPPYWATNGLGGWTTNSMLYQADRIASNALPLCAAYAIPLCRFDQAESNLVVTGVLNLSTNYVYPDGLHPSTTGQYWRAGQILPFITDSWVRGVHAHPSGTVTEVFSGSDYWATATTTWFPAAGGADGSSGGVTWTWSGSGWADASVTMTDTITYRAFTARQSSTTGDKLTVTGTWRLFALHWPKNATNLRWRIDGGSWNTLNHHTATAGYVHPMATTGSWYGEAAAGAHTIEIEVTAASAQILGWFTM